MQALLCAALVSASLGVWASPEDDYRAGMQAYRSGDVVGAMSTLRRAADQGHAPAQAQLAFIVEGAGFLEDAVRYYRMAAEQGNVDGEVGLANLLMTGSGVARDERAALRLLERAADRGHAGAAQSVADAYLQKSLGLTTAARDNRQAVAALRRAADRGYLPAIDGLAAAYLVGDFGLAADAAEARRWQARAQQLRQERAKAGKKDNQDKAGKGAGGKP